MKRIGHSDLYYYIGRLNKLGYSKVSTITKGTTTKLIMKSPSGKLVVLTYTVNGWVSVSDYNSN